MNPIQLRVGNFMPTTKEYSAFRSLSEEQQESLVNALSRYFLLQGINSKHVINMDQFKKIANSIGISIPPGCMNVILKIVNERLNDTFGLTIAPIPTKVKALTKQQMAEIKQSQMSQSASQSVAQLLNADTSTESATQTQGNDSEIPSKILSASSVVEYVLINTLQTKYPNFKKYIIDDEYEKGLLIIALITVFLSPDSRIESEALTKKLKPLWPEIVDSKSKYALENCLTRWARNRYLTIQKSTGPNDDKIYYILGTRTYSEIGIETLEKFICDTLETEYTADTHLEWTLGEK